MTKRDLIIIIDSYEGNDLVGVAETEAQAKKIAEAYAYGECDGECFIQFFNEAGDELMISY